MARVTDRDHVPMIALVRHPGSDRQRAMRQIRVNGGDRAKAVRIERAKWGHGVEFAWLRDDLTYEPVDPAHEPPQEVAA